MKHHHRLALLTLPLQHKSNRSTCYRLQRSSGKVMFVHLSVILFTGVGVSASVHAEIHSSGQVHPLAVTPPWQVHPPQEANPWRNTPGSTPLLRRSLQRTVRILLECFLSTFLFLYCLVGSNTADIFSFPGGSEGAQRSSEVCLWFDA